MTTLYLQDHNGTPSSCSHHLHLHFLNSLHPRQETFHLVRIQNGTETMIISFLLSIGTLSLFLIIIFRCFSVVLSCLMYSQYCFRSHLPLIFIASIPCFFLHIWFPFISSIMLYQFCSSYYDFSSVWYLSFHLC